MTAVLFRDRADAGRHLAARLMHLRDPDVVVLGLPCGGVPVAFEVARELGSPLDVVVVRKVRAPYRKALAMGALGEGGVVVVNEPVVREQDVSRAVFTAAAEAERAELDRRARTLRRGRPQLPVDGRIALVVDDGADTGSTARAACQVVRAAGARRVVFAVPVAAPASLDTLRAVADDVVCLETPPQFLAIGQWYAAYPPVSEDEVAGLVDEARRLAERPPHLDLTARDTDVTVEVAGTDLPGHLTLPESAPLAVVFAPGAGGNRYDPRNRSVAAVLNRAGLGTLLLDLLTPGEEADRANLFDIGLLARRLSGAASWLRESEAVAARVAYFGAGTGAAAALWAAAEPDAAVAAVVGGDGRPDLAWQRLGAVVAPTLLVVAAGDRGVLDLNRAALAHLRCEARLAVVPGATHLFEEPGALRALADLSGGWYFDHLVPAGREAG